ncbi:MAG: ubiquinol-cytochrome c reductase iron-sulfur subunit [Henriciella sp.]|uniref:ubiquinol-cytochrome c reductase iron-sulfur subunit n=1 Tax=Henriciella sp. TaxID=1968823 RepID=UPI003C73377D
MSDAQNTTHEAIDEDRRDFIHIATAATAVAGAGALAYAFIDQMNAANDTKAASSLEVDVSKVPLGGEIRVLIGGKPFFIRHRTEAEIAAAVSVDVSTLPDPETDADRLRPLPDGELNRAILVTSGSCTHLGCVPVGPAQGNTGDYGGWYCPCHGSHYDTSGRIRRGPAPANLPVPDYEYVSPTVINISL